MKIQKKRIHLVFKIFFYFNFHPFFVIGHIYRRIGMFTRSIKKYFFLKTKINNQIQNLFHVIEQSDVSHNTML